jgi:hypothetical protein
MYHELPEAKDDGSFLPLSSLGLTLHVHIPAADKLSREHMVPRGVAQQRPRPTDYPTTPQSSITMALSGVPHFRRVFAALAEQSRHNASQTSATLITATVIPVLPHPTHIHAFS